VSIATAEKKNTGKK